MKSPHINALRSGLSLASLLLCSTALAISGCSDDESTPPPVAQNDAALDSSKTDSGWDGASPEDSSLDSSEDASSDAPSDSLSDSEPGDTAVDIEDSSLDSSEDTARDAANDSPSDSEPSEAGDSSLDSSEDTAPDAPEDTPPDSELPDTIAEVNDQDTPDVTQDGSCEGWDTLVRLIPSELFEVLESSDPYFINVHIPYAGEIPETDAHIPFNDVDAIEEFVGHDPCADIILYCLTGPMSVPAGNELIARGYHQVRDLQGGMNAWNAAGYPFVEP